MGMMSQESILHIIIIIIIIIIIVIVIVIVIIIIWVQSMTYVLPLQLWYCLQFSVMLDGLYGDETQCYWTWFPVISIQTKSICCPIYCVSRRWTTS